MTKEEAIKYLQQLYPNGGHCWLDEQRIEAIGIAINALREEPASEDLIDASNNYCLTIRKGYPRVKDETDVFICNAFKHGAQWQRERMMKDAAEGQFDYNHIIVPYSELARVFPNGKDGDKVKVIIVKE